MKSLLVIAVVSFIVVAAYAGHPYEPGCPPGGIPAARISGAVCYDICTSQHVPVQCYVCLLACWDNCGNWFLNCPEWGIIEYLECKDAVWDAWLADENCPNDDSA